MEPDDAAERLRLPVNASLSCSTSYMDSAPPRAHGFPGAGQRVRGEIQELAFGGPAVA